MKTWKPWALGVMVAAVATACLVPALSPSRSVRILPLADPAAAARFEPAQSTGLFVGVRRYLKANTLEVPYAADDAVDLAYMFALHPRVRLVPPERVVIALAGRPQKAESQRRLEQLKAAGAIEVKADRETIVAMLQRQAAAAGKDGMFVLSLATHGYVREGTPYILGSDDELSTARIFDIASTSPARRALMFIDACRERITAGQRGLGGEPQTAAPLVSRMGRVEGLVVFYAAAANKWAYDDKERENGVFTKNVLDGLDCKATPVREVVTVDALRKYVERETLGWIRKHHDPNLGAAIQVSMDGRSDNMPLSRCSIAPVFQDDPAEVESMGSNITALGPTGKRLWTHDLGAAVLQARILPKRLPEIIALTASRLSILGADRRVLASYPGDFALREFAIDRPTARHAMRVIVRGDRELLVVDSKRKFWRKLLAPATERFTRMEVIDDDNDSRRDIVLWTASGVRFVLDFDGDVLKAVPAPGTSRSQAALLSRR